jgi:TonB family protein
MEIPKHTAPSVAPVPVSTPPPEPPPTLVAPIQTNSAMILQSAGNSSISLAPMGGGGSGGGIGSGKGNGVGDGTGGGFGGGAYAPGSGVSWPKVITEVKPKYTPDAMRAKLQGAVELEIVVKEDGTVGDVRVTKSLDRASGLDDAAMAAARKWLFSPGMKEGKPVPTRVGLVLEFRLH